MGRFFQAQPIQLSKDNIYQPPLELMMAVLDKKNAEVQQTGDNAQKLLDSLDFNYDAIDADNAKNIIKEVSDKVNNATEIFNKDLSSPEARRMLNSLKDEVKSRYTSGDIYNIQQTDNNKKAFEQQMDDAKLSELDKERHRAYFNNWAKENPTGSLKNFFTPGNIIEDEDYIPQVLKDFKLITPSEMNSRIDNLKKFGYITKNTKDVEAVVKEHYLKDWVDAHPQVQDQIRTRKNSGLYNEREVIENPDGSFDYNKGLLKQQADFIKGYNYSKTTVGKDYQADSFAIHELDYGRQKAKEAEENKVAQLFEINKDASEIYNNSVAVRNHEQVYLDNLKKNLNFGKAVPDNITEFISILEKQKNKSALMINKIKEAKSIQRDVQNAMKASYAPLYNAGADEKTVDKLRKGLNDNLVANGQSQKYRLPPMQIIDKSGKTTSVVLKDGYQEFIPKNMVGKYKMTPDGRKLLIKNVVPVENSVIPILLNSPSGNGRSINDNDAHVTLQFTLVGEDGKDFSYRQTGYYNMNEGAGFSQN